MQTATVEVKYVNPPKNGRQYGSIKGANNDTWPVKADRLREFEPNNAYEIAYTKGTNGFPNIIGVKRLGSEPQMQGEFTQVAPQPLPTPLQAPAQSTKATQSEHIFACGGLYRDIEMGRVGTSEDELVERTILWRNVYRRAFPE